MPFTRNYTSFCFRLDDGSSRKRRIRLLKAASNTGEEDSEVASSSSAGVSPVVGGGGAQDNHGGTAGMKLGTWFNGKQRRASLNRGPDNRYGDKKRFPNRKNINLKQNISSLIFPTPVFLSNLDSSADGKTQQQQQQQQHQLQLHQQPQVRTNPLGPGAASEDSSLDDPDILHDTAADPHPSNRVRVLPSSSAASSVGGGDHSNAADAAAAAAAAAVGRKLSGKMRRARKKRAGDTGTSYSVNSKVR